MLNKRGTSTTQLARPIPFSCGTIFAKPMFATTFTVTILFTV